MRSTEILDGRRVRDVHLSRLKQQYEKLEEQLQLVVIRIGDFKENELYVKQKKKMANILGVQFTEIVFSALDSMSLVLEKIDELNLDPTVHGIMIQSPVPDSFSFFDLVDAIDPKKDVDGLTSFHQNNLSINPRIVPATVRGIFSLLEFYHLIPRKRKVVVLGKSRLVGFPLVKLLEKENEVVLCDSKTEHILEKIKEADYVFIAIGKPLWLKLEMLQENAVVIDVGTTVCSGKLFGDCDFSSVLGSVRAITPVPGGVGPLTVLSLFMNLLDLYGLQTRE